MHYKLNGNNETSRKGPNVYKRKFSKVRTRESRFKEEKLGFRKRESLRRNYNWMFCACVKNLVALQSLG